MKTSYPKSKINVLLLENIHDEAVSQFKSEKYNVIHLSHSLSEDELCEKIKDIHILGIRSKTTISEKILRSANHLWAIGAFCVGTKQIDLMSCSDHGVIVFNAPYSNTRSVVELAISEIIFLMRQIFPRSMEMHQGQWRKVASRSFEVRGKKLGIVGYGNIGSQLSVLAENLGMEVYYYDPVEKLALGNAKKCSALKELLKTVDVVSLHVDDNPSNHELMGKREFAHMNQGSYFMNLSRGFVVDVNALADALQSGHLAGAAIDVFPEEPKANTDEFDTILQNIPNVILTPHVGGSTEEAQCNIAKFVPSNIIHYINMGDSFMSVNFPQIQLSSFENSHRLIHIHKNAPGVLANINKLFAKHHINILGQYLKTNERIGYVITDVDKHYDEGLIAELREVPYTLKFRVLY
ncbi:MAG: phosphoglycerate dehydrogenase [Gammaproteobacteria bacterium]